MTKYYHLRLSNFDGLLADLHYEVATDDSSQVRNASNPWLDVELGHEVHAETLLYVTLRAIYTTSLGQM